MASCAPISAAARSSALRLMAAAAESRVASLARAASRTSASVGRTSRAGRSTPRMPLTKWGAAASAAARSSKERRANTLVPAISTEAVRAMRFGAFMTSTPMTLLQVFRGLKSGDVGVGVGVDNDRGQVGNVRAVDLGQRGGRGGGAVEAGQGSGGDRKGGGGGGGGQGFYVSTPVVVWVTGVVVNYNTRFSVVNQNFVKFHMTYGLCRAALCWWGASVALALMRLWRARLMRAAHRR